ncbi:MAG: M24 family metallopeptidase [Dongiaceae bacterium]
MGIKMLGAARIGKLQSAMAKHRIDAMICIKPENSFYLSGFNPIIYSHPVVAVLPAEGEPQILVHALRDDHARAEAWVSKVHLFGSWSNKKTMGPSWLKALASIAENLALGRARIGLEFDFLPVNKLEQIREALPQASFVDCSELLSTTRMIKDPFEIESLRAASRIADAGMETAIGAIAAGVSEREISIAAMATMNRVWNDRFPSAEVCEFGSLEGGTHNGLWCWCMIDDRICLNTDNPTDRRPKRGEVVLAFIWTVCNGMHAENERLVAVGQLGDARRRAYDAVLQIREQTKTMLKPGTPMADIYGAARQEYIRLGYGDYVPGRIGHGLGLGAHEPPFIDQHTQRVLEPNMIVTFEPGLSLEDCALQHSDTVLITETGHEFLTRTSNGFLSV